jgi:hypothetical protein
VASQKIRPDAGDVASFAPQHTKCSGRNRKNNGLAGCGESFSGQAVTVRTEKTVVSRLGPGPVRDVELLPSAHMFLKNALQIYGIVDYF